MPEARAIGNGEYAHFIAVWDSRLEGLSASEHDALLERVDALLAATIAAEGPASPSAWQMRATRFPVGLQSAAADWIGVFVGFSADGEADVFWDEGLRCGKASWSRPEMDASAERLADALTDAVKACSPGTAPALRSGADPTAGFPRRAARSVVFAVSSKSRSRVGHGLLEPSQAATLARLMRDDEAESVVEIPSEAGDGSSAEGADLYDNLVSHCLDLMVCLDKLDYADVSFPAAKDAVDRLMLALSGMPLRSPTVADVALIAANAREIAVKLDFHSGYDFELDKTATTVRSALDAIGAGHDDDVAGSGLSASHLVKARMDNWSKLEAKLRSGLETRIGVLNAIETELAAVARGREGVVAAALGVFGAALGLGFVAQALSGTWPDVLTTERLQYGFQLAFITSAVLGFLLSRLVGYVIERADRRYFASVTAPGTATYGAQRPWYSRPMVKTAMQMAVAAVLPLALVLATTSHTAGLFDSVDSPREASYQLLSMVRRDVSPSPDEARYWTTGALESSRDRLRAAATAGVPNIDSVNVEPPFATVYVRVETGQRGSYGFVMLRFRKSLNSAGAWQWVVEDVQTVAPGPATGTAGS